MTDVSEIFMQQFWYTIKKVQDTNSYEFLLANKKCTVNAEVFKTILNICQRVEGVDFTDVPDDNTALTFLIDLCYKGPLNRENIDYPALIWEDIAYHIDHRKEKRSRRENMPYPRFTKIIINHFLKQHKSLTNLNHKHYHTIKDDGIVSRLKFVRIESEPETEPAKKKNASRRVVKKKVTLSTDDNIISDDHDAALELAKSISQTEAEEAEAARKVYATHARIMTESVPEYAKKKSGGRSSKSVVIQDTPSAIKSKPATSNTKLKGASSLIPKLKRESQEQEAANIMQALKESKKSSRRQPGTGGSNEGTGSKPRVPDESTVISATSSEGNGAKLRVPDEDKDITKEKVILEWGGEQDSEFSDDDNDDVEKDDKDDDADDEGNDHVSDTQDADDEVVKTKYDKDEIYKYKIRVRNEEDVEMKDAEVEKSDKGKEKVTDAAKEEAKKTSEAKDDTKKYELPQSSSSLSVSSDADVSSLLDIPIQHENPQTQSPSKKDVSELKTIDHSSEALVVLQSQVPTVVDSYLDTKVGDVFQKELQKHTADLIHKYSLQHLPELTKKPTPTTKQESEKSPSDILKIKKEQAEKQKKP
ncbi:hypothetical protein Tco_0371488 [Tanacetum coccineum]